MSNVECSAILKSVPTFLEKSSSLRLERRNPSENMMRYYAMQVTPGLFGEWCLVRSWGRIGSGGQTRMEWYTTQAQ